MSKEIIVVASKVKKAIKDKSGMNTSAAAIDELSLHAHVIIEKAQEVAKADGRKTVMDRDIREVVEGRKQMEFPA